MFEVSLYFKTYEDCVKFNFSVLRQSLVRLQAYSFIETLPVSAFVLCGLSPDPVQPKTYIIVAKFANLSSQYKSFLIIFHFYLFILFIQKTKTESEISHFLAHSSKAHSRQEVARSKPVDGNSRQDSHVDARNAGT